MNDHPNERSGFLATLAAPFMRVDPSVILVIALFAMAAGALLQYAPSFLGWEQMQDIAYDAYGNRTLPSTITFLITATGFAGYILVNLPFPLAIFAAGRLIADAIQSKSVST